MMRVERLHGPCEQILRRVPERHGDIIEQQDVDPLVAAFDLADIPLRLSDQKAELALLQAGLLSRLPQYASEDFLTPLQCHTRR
nr:hypothetical protein [uncultured Sphingomonas sp.]